MKDKERAEYIQRQECILKILYATIGCQMIILALQVWRLLEK